MSGCCHWKSSGSLWLGWMCGTLSVLNLHCVYSTSFHAALRVFGYCCCRYCCLRCSFDCCGPPGDLSVSWTGMKSCLLQGQQVSTYCSGCFHHYRYHAGHLQTRTGLISLLLNTSCSQVYHQALEVCLLRLALSFRRNCPACSECGWTVYLPCWTKEKSKDSKRWSGEAREERERSKGEIDK